jgi:hypothetical protein
MLTEWTRTGGPILRERAAAALATNRDTKIADFVAVGKPAAVAADKQTELSAAQQAATIKVRVEQIVASDGYEVRSAGPTAPARRLPPRVRKPTPPRQTPRMVVPP